MAFKVDVPLNNAYPLTPVPAVLRSPLPTMQTATKTRKLILFEGEDEYGRLLPMLGTVDGGAMEFHDPITENPDLNSTEIWEIYNLTPDSHPIHLHLVSFRVLSSQEFSGTVNEETGALSNIQLVGPLKKPEPGQAGKKDTYPIAPGEVTRLIATFDKEGLYAWHCHILSHEDHDMMRPYYVGTVPAGILANLNKIVEDIIEAGNGVFTVYPNPFSGSATLKLNLHESAAAVGLRLLDLNGTQVLEVLNQQLEKGEHQLEINGSSLPKGIYVCEVSVNNKLYRSLLVLER
jgi:spore coat protein A, manganese oxidase